MLTMATMLGPEPHSDREILLESHSGLHGSLSPAARSSLEGDIEQLQHADNSTDRGVTAPTDPAWTHIEEMGYMLGSLLFPADSPGIAQLIGTKTVGSDIVICTPKPCCLSSSRPQTSTLPLMRSEASSRLIALAPHGVLSAVSQLGKRMDTRRAPCRSIKF